MRFTAERLSVCEGQRLCFIEQTHIYIKVLFVQNEQHLNAFHYYFN
jgi:hypothetical protein